MSVSMSMRVVVHVNVPVNVCVRVFSIINILYLHILYGNNFAYFVTNDINNLSKETAQKYLSAKIKSKKKKNPLRPISIKRLA